MRVVAASWRQVDERAQAIEALYREHYGRFRDVVTAITGDRASARDVVQEAFARALRKRRSFRGDGSLEGWLWRIALRTAREHVGRRPGVSLNGALPAELVEAERDRPRVLVGQEAAQHVLQDPAVAEVVALLRRL